MRKTLALVLCSLCLAQVASAFQVTSTWLSANSGNWSDPANWSTNPDYPRNHSPLGTTYQALINSAGGVYSINFDAGSISLAGLNLTAPLATLSHSTGTLVLDSGTISAGTYLFNGGFLGGSGNIDVYSAMVYNGGILGGSGSLNIHAGGSLTVGTLTSRFVTRTIANSGTVNFSNFASLALTDGTFLNSGWTNFNNTPTGFTFSGGTANFVGNTGTINLNSPTMSFQFNAPYVNSGTINVQAGTVQYTFGSYTHNAGTRFSGNGTLIANLGTMLFNGASTLSTAKVFFNGSYITGPGSITNNTNLQWNAGSIDGGGRLINNATLTIGTLSTRVLGRMLVNNGTINFLDYSGLTLSNGTINNNGWMNLGAASTPFSQGAGSNNLINNTGTINLNAPTASFQFYSVGYRNSGTINVQSGTLSYSFGTFTHEEGTRFTGAGTVLFANSGTMQFNGDATFTVARARFDSGSFGGAGDLYLESTFDFNGGSFGGGGTAWNTGTLNIGTYSTRYLARTLSNSAIVNFLPGTSLILSGGTFDNQGVVNFTNVSNPFSSGGGTNNLVRNSGTFNINSPSTTFNLSGSLVNSGTINLQTGTTIFSFGTYTLNAGTRFIGDGALLANAGTFFINGASTFSNARTILGGAFLRSSDVLTLAGTTDWNAGSITGSGSINNVGTMNIGTLSSRYLVNTLVNNGTVNFLPGAQVFLNNGTFINNGYTQWGSPGGFLQTGGTTSFLSNAGTIDLALGSADSYTFPIGYTNSGTINVQAGTLAYNTLNYFFHDPGSRITGAGIVAMNAGTLLFFGDSTITTAQANFTGARIDGSGTLHLHTGANWSNGTMTGSGTTTIEPGGLLNVVPGGNAVLSRYLVNYGQATLQTGGVLSLNNGTFVNASVGTLFINSNPNFFAAPTGLVRNDGTVVVANADVTITVPFLNNGTVIVGSTPAPGPAAAASQLSLTNLSQLSNGILEGGSWVVNDDAQLTLPGNVQDSHAAITLTGSALMPQLATMTSNRGTLTLSGGQAFSSVGNLSNEGVLRILTGSQMSIPGNLTATGTVQLQGLLSLTGSSGVSTIDHLSVLGGSIDVTRNDLILKGNSGTFTALLTSGYSDGFWDGAGIRSSTAFADQQTLGFAVASDLFAAFPATYRGMNVDADSFIIAYTFSGDSNLDGKVNTIDFNSLAGSFGSSGKKWVNGDFDYNGNVDSIDFTQMVSSFGRSAAPAPTLGSMIPEPASMLLFAAISMICRRRR